MENVTQLTRKLEKDTDSGLKETITQNFECKICKSLPRSQIVVMSCCNQLLGCAECLDRAIREGNNECPLCRNPNPSSIALKGFDEVVEKLQTTSGDSSSV